MVTQLIVIGQGFGYKFRNTAKLNFFFLEK